MKRHEDEFYLLMRSLVTDIAIGKFGVMSSRANSLLHKLKHLEALRLAAKPADEGQSLVADGMAIYTTKIEVNILKIVGKRAYIANHDIGTFWTDLSNLSTTREPKR